MTIELRFGGLVGHISDDGAISAGGLTGRLVGDLTNGTIYFGGLVGSIVDGQARMAGMRATIADGVIHFGGMEGTTSGSTSVTVPDVVGEQLAAATSTLEGLGLVVDSSEVYDPVVPDGEVMTQDPAAGSSVAPGTTVDLVASNGPTPDPYFANVVLLAHFDGTNGQTTTTDVKGHTLTMSACALSTTQFKAGTASLALSAAGSSQSISSPNSADWAMGSGDFTVEAYVYVTATDAFSRNIVVFDEGSAVFKLAIAASLVEFGCRDVDGGSITAYSFTAPPTNQWFHVAAVRNGTSFKVYLNGVAGAVAPTSSKALAASASALKIAPLAFATLAGYVDEVRVTKGVARYTANFTPPSTPFPNS